MGVQDGLRPSDRESGSGIFGTKGFLGTALGEPGSVLSHVGEEGQAEISSITTGPPRGEKCHRAGCMFSNTKVSSETRPLTHS